MSCNRDIVFHEEPEIVIDSTTTIEAGSVCPLCNGEKNIDGGTKICWKCHGTGIRRIPNESEYDEDTVFPPGQGIFGNPNE